MKRSQTDIFYFAIVCLLLPFSSCSENSEKVAHRNVESTATQESTLQTRESFIERDLIRIEQQLENLYGDDDYQNRLGLYKEKVEEAYKTRMKTKKENKDIGVIEGRDGYYFTKSSLEYTLADSYLNKERVGAPFRAILQAHELLANLGIDLIFVPVPTSAEVYPDKLFDGFPYDFIVAPKMLEFKRDLLRAGVEVIDLLPVFQEYRDKNPDDQLYYLRNIHWNLLGAKTSAEAISERLRRYRFESHSPYSIKSKAIDANTGLPFSMIFDKNVAPPFPFSQLFSNDEWQTLIADYPNQNPPISYVVDSKGAMYNPLESHDSPILLLGDSFSHTGALVSGGVASHLAASLSSPVDLQTFFGSITLFGKILGYRSTRIEKRKVILCVVFSPLLQRDWALPPSLEDIQSTKNEDASPMNLNVVARVLKTSSLPNPLTANYSDALLCTEYEVLKSDLPIEDDIVIVREWCMYNRQIKDCVRKPGESYNLKLELYEAAIEMYGNRRLLKTMLIDNTDSFDAPVYWLQDAKRYYETATLQDIQDADSLFEWYGLYNRFLELGGNEADIATALETKRKDLSSVSELHSISPELDLVGFDWHLEAEIDENLGVYRSSWLFRKKADLNLEAGEEFAFIFQLFPVNKPSGSPQTASPTAPVKKYIYPERPEPLAKWPTDDYYLYSVSFTLPRVDYRGGCSPFVALDRKYKRGFGKGLSLGLLEQ